MTLENREEDDAYGDPQDTLDEQLFLCLVANLMSREYSSEQVPHAKRPLISRF